MKSDRKKGLILIVLGICVPLFALPFLSGFSKDKGFTDNLYSVGIQIRKEPPAKAAANLQPPEKRKLTYSDVLPRRIQFRFILALGVIFLFAGFMKLERSRERPHVEGPGS